MTDIKFRWGYVKVEGAEFTGVEMSKFGGQWWVRTRSDE